MFPRRKGIFPTSKAMFTSRKGTLRRRPGMFPTWKAILPSFKGMFASRTGTLMTSRGTPDKPPGSRRSCVYHVTTLTDGFTPRGPRRLESEHDPPRRLSARRGGEAQGVRLPPHRPAERRDLLCRQGQSQPHLRPRPRFPPTLPPTSTDTNESTPTDDSTEDDELSDKLRRIRDIRSSGFEVQHVIHRHGMDEKTAFAVEAALIDAYPGLTNIAGGTHNADVGTMHAEEIIRRYEAKEATFEHKCLLISVNRSAAERDLYDATRFAWRLDPKRAKQADVVLSVIRGVIVGAFVADAWLPDEPGTFTTPDGRESRPGRWGFVGREAPPELSNPYIGRRVPDGMRKQGASNPILYSWRK